MKTLFQVFPAVVLLLLPSFVQASTWAIDPDHSSIQFKVRHLMISNVKGVFHKVQGVIEADEKDLRKATVNVTIDTNSIDTGVTKRDEHLRSPDFFDVARYPVMTFVSKRVVKSTPDTLKVTGDLTIRGVTREVVLEVEGPSPEIKDPLGSIRRGVSASSKINRKDFGLTWNKALETGGVVVGDDVIINLEVELVRK